MCHFIRTLWMEGRLYESGEVEYGAAKIVLFCFVLPQLACLSLPNRLSVFSLWFICVSKGEIFSSPAPSPHHSKAPLCKAANKGCPDFFYTWYSRIDQSWPVTQVDPLFQLGFWFGFGIRIGSHIQNQKEPKLNKGWLVMKEGWNQCCPVISFQMYPLDTNKTFKKKIHDERISTKKHLITTPASYTFIF